MFSLHMYIYTYTYIYIHINIYIYILKYISSVWCHGCRFGVTLRWNCRSASSRPNFADLPANLRNPAWTPCVGRTRREDFLGMLGELRSSGMNWYELTFFSDIWVFVIRSFWKDWKDGLHVTSWDHETSRNIPSFFQFEIASGRAAFPWPCVDTWGGLWILFVVWALFSRLIRVSPTIQTIQTPLVSVV